MIKKITLSLAATLLLSASSLSAQTFATVDGENITESDIATVIRDPRIQFDKLPKEQQDQVIQQLVEKKLLTKKAFQSGVESQPAFKEAMEKLKKEIALEVWMQDQYKDIQVSDAEIKGFYQKNKDKFKQPEQYRARHILLKSEADAKAIIDELNKAGDKQAKFIDLAKTKSTGPSGPNGGDLNWFTADRMVPEFSNATKQLKKGAYSKTPVKTQFGYHVIYLEDTKPASTVKLEDATNQIKQAITQEKFRAKIKEIADAMRKTSKISIK